MKKVTALVLTLVLIFTFSATTFAATGNPTDMKMSGVTDVYTDIKTGISFTAPEEWVVCYSNIKHGAVGNGTSYTSRQIDIFTGIGQIQILQVGKSKSFVVSIKESDTIYFIDEKGVTTKLNNTSYYYVPAQDESDWGLQMKAIDALIASISVVKKN